jgi:hypothetical protein
MMEGGRMKGLCDGLNSKVILIEKENFMMGCGILKLVGPKKHDFWPRINILKENFSKKSADELWFGTIQVLRHHVFDFFRPTHSPL